MEVPSGLISAEVEPPGHPEPVMIKEEICICGACLESMVGAASARAGSRSKEESFMMIVT
jgi:hypothetical protein